MLQQGEHRVANLVARYADAVVAAADAIAGEARALEPSGRVVTIANGTLTRNTQRQLALVTSHPPARGPMTKAMPVHAVQEPITAPRT